MRISLSMTVAAMLTTASIAHAQPSSTFGGLRIAPGHPAQREQAAGRRNPYGRLFGDRTQPAPVVAPRPTVPPPAEPVVTCGLTMIPGDPAIDPGIAAPTPPTGQRFHSRTVTPTICR